MNNELVFTDYENGLDFGWVESTDYVKLGAKTTICLITLVNGFEIVGTSACVNPEMFDFEIGKFYAKRDALSKLDELVGFYKQMEGEK